MPTADTEAAAKPYVTFVGWTRNDGYTPNYVERTRQAVLFLLRQLERHRVPAELLVVEWNPPSDRPHIAELLDDLAGITFTTVRFVTVGHEYHRTYDGWERRGVPTVECVNVGMRRARGRFITPKGLDTFLSEALVAEIARLCLDENCVYRCDRYDVTFESDVWLDKSSDDLFRLFDRAPAVRHRRLEQSRLWHIRDLHTNGCGDFTLLAGERWRRMNGYPKDGTVIGFDADSIALHAAAAYGAREVCLPDACVVFKITHGRLNANRSAFEWKPWQQRLDRFLVHRGKERLAQRMRMWLDYPPRRAYGMLGPSIERNFVARAERYARNDVSVPYNDANWGWGNVDFPERTLVRAAWEG
jgi:hypothetical protein